MAIDRVKNTARTAPTAPTTDHGFGAVVRRTTPAAHNIPPGLKRKLEAGEEVKNWKLAGGGQPDGPADHADAASGKGRGKADKAARPA